jgi:hypothetical protein
MTTSEYSQDLSGRIAEEFGGESIPGRGAVAALARLFAVFLLFSLITLFFFWPVISHLHSALIGPPEDNLQDYWNTWYVLLAHDPLHFFRTSLLHFPEGTSLIYQSFAWPQLLAVFLLSRIIGTDPESLTALQNLTILASFPLAGTGAFYLVRHFVRSTAGGLIGGFVFAFNPSHVAHAMHHAHVSSIEFLPAFALAWLVALERRSMKWLAIAVVFYALSALSCWYYLFYGAYFMGFQLLYARVRDGVWPCGWPLAAAALCTACAVALLSPQIIPMVLAAGPSAYRLGGNLYVADILGWITFPPEHLLSGISRGLNARFSGDAWEATVYLGLANLAILGWQCRRTGIGRKTPMFYVLFGMLVFGVLASGETLHIAGISTLLPLPDVVLDKLPFFANVRTPSRAVVFVCLFMSIGIGYAFSAILERRGTVSRAAALALAVLVAVDFYPARLAATPIGCSPALATLRADPGHGFGVLNLPWGYEEENSYLLEQTCHRRPIVDGITTRDMGDSLVYNLKLADIRAQREQLIRSNVKYILIHKPRNGLYAWNKDLAPISQFLRTYREVYDGPDMIVLRVY